MVRFSALPQEARVAVAVVVQHVSERRPHETENDGLVVFGWGHGEDPLGPVTDLAVATAEEPLHGNGADERGGEGEIASGAGPVNGGTEVGPQLGEPRDTLDLGVTAEQLTEVVDLSKNVSVKAAIYFKNTDTRLLPMTFAGCDDRAMKYKRIVEKYLASLNVILRGL